MINLIIGTPDSGKSKLAEDLITAEAGDRCKYYVATMIPYGEEGALRVAKHRAMIEGKGFTTVEIPFDVCKADIPANSIVLLECVSNLAANEMFGRHIPADKCEGKIVSDIGKLAVSVSDIVIVTNHFEITEEFDGETILYSLMMDRINHKLSILADKVTDLRTR